MITTTETGWRNNGAKTMLLRLLKMGAIPYRKPKIEIGKNYSCKQKDKLQDELWIYTITHKCMEDSLFCEAILLEKDIRPIWGTETIAGKEYQTLDFEIVYEN